jgi:hypothetical protein
MLRDLFPHRAPGMAARRRGYSLIWQSLLPVASLFTCKNLENPPFSIFGLTACTELNFPQAAISF